MVMPLTVLFLFRLLIMICDGLLAHRVSVLMWDGRPYKGGGQLWGLCEAIPGVL